MAWNAGRAIFISLCAAFMLGHLSDAKADDFGRSPTLTKSIEKEFGTTRGNYFGFGGRVSDQIFMGMGNPLPSRQLADGNYLVSGCRPHDCDEKAAVVATPAGVVLAAGAVNFPCAMRRKVEGLQCRGSVEPPVLTIFVRKKNNLPATLQDLKDWAQGAQLADRKEYPSQPILDIALTEIRIVREASPQ